MYVTLWIIVFRRFMKMGVARGKKIRNASGYQNNIFFTVINKQMYMYVNSIIVVRRVHIERKLLIIINLRESPLKMSAISCVLFVVLLSECIADTCDSDLYDIYTLTR